MRKAAPSSRDRGAGPAKHAELERTVAGLPRCVAELHLRMQNVLERLEQENRLDSPGDAISAMVALWRVSMSCAYLLRCPPRTAPAGDNDEHHRWPWIGELARASVDRSKKILGAQEQQNFTVNPQIDRIPRRRLCWSPLPSAAIEALLRSVDGQQMAPLASMLSALPSHRAHDA